MPTPLSPARSASSDPASRLYRNARREALIVALVWFICMLWVVGYCYLRGYVHPGDSWLVQSGLAAGPDEVFATLWGIPRWIVFGILIPWLLASAFTIWFGMYGMPDDELGGERGDGE